MQLLFRCSARAASSVKSHLSHPRICWQNFRSASSAPHSRLNGRNLHIRKIDPYESITTKDGSQSKPTDANVFENTWTWLKRGKAGDFDHLINPHSLEETLEAHRKANREKITIYKIKHDVPDSLSLPSRESTSPSLPKSHAVVKHLVLDRDPSQDEIRGWREYNGESQPLTFQWRSNRRLPRYLRFPWVQGLDNIGPSSSSAVSRLNDEIRSADAYFTPTSDEKRAADFAVQEIRSLVLKHGRGIEQVDVIGSRASGMAHPLSDIDVNIRVRGSHMEESRQRQLETLSRLFRRLRYTPSLHSVVTIHFLASRARVPIIVGTHLPTGLEFQIQQTSTSYNSLEFSKVLDAEFPTLRALFKIIKQMLAMRGLTSGVRGGITSYPLLNMIVASLKIHEFQTNPYDFGRQLLDFLDFFGDINFYETGIAQRPGKYMQQKLDNSVGDTSDWFTLPDAVVQDPVGAMPVLFDVRKTHGDLHKAKNDFMMTLHDPTNPYNDLGQSAYNIKHIQATLIEVRTQLMKSMARWDATYRQHGSSDFKPEPLLMALLEADYSLYIRDRKNVVSGYEERKTLLEDESSMHNQSGKDDESGWLI